MAGTIRKSRVKGVPLSEVKDDLSHLLREAAKREIVITRHGKPAGVLIGFASEDDWFEYRLENDPRFLRRIENARASRRSVSSGSTRDLLRPLCRLQQDKRVRLAQACALVLDGGDPREFFIQRLILGAVF